VKRRPARKKEAGRDQILKGANGDPTKTGRGKKLARRRKMAEVTGKRGVSAPFCWRRRPGGEGRKKSAACPQQD